MTTRNTDWVMRAPLLVIASCLIVLVAHTWLTPPPLVSADSARFDHVQIVSPMYLYRGNQGVLLMDKRNGNVWFIGRTEKMELSFKDPLFVVHLPLEKLDQPPN